MRTDLWTKDGCMHAVLPHVRALPHHGQGGAKIQQAAVACIVVLAHDTCAPIDRVQAEQFLP